MGLCVTNLRELEDFEPESRVGISLKPLSQLVSLVLETWMQWFQAGHLL
jgi:hypothetical protein